MPLAPPPALPQLPGRTRFQIQPNRTGEPPRSYRFTFALDLFNGEHERALSRQVLDEMLKCLWTVDRLYLMTHPNAPLLYESDVRYMEEPPGQEEWQDVPTCLAMGIADCEDLACWRAAELNVRYGVAAHPFFREQKLPDGRYLYHILVQWPPGTYGGRAYPQGYVEDPSRTKGMQ